MTTVEFTDPETGVVELRFTLDADSEYAYLQHSLLGEHTVSTTGTCQFAVKDGVQTTLRSEDITVDLVAGQPIVIAQPNVDFPRWDEMYRQFQMSKQ